MIAFQFLPILVNYDYKVSRIPLSTLSNLPLVLDNDGGQTKISVVVTSTGDVKQQVITKLKLKIEKLRLYLKVITNNEITLRNITTFELEYKNEDFNKHLHPLFGSVKDDTELSNYLESPLNPQQKILEKALDEHKKGDIFNSFPKLINWLDDNAGKGSSRFCCVRDVCSHGKTDDAIHKVNQKFPNEFEFDDGIFNMDSQQNLQNLNMHLPEVFSQIEKTFLEKYV